VSKALSLLVSLFILTLAQPVEAVEAAGKISYISGAVVAQRPDGTVMVLGQKAAVFEGDMLVTAKESYAQVLMNDGAKMTLRPDSNLKIEAFQFKKESPQTDNAVFRLLKGGFRAVTGLIGKRGNPDAYKLRAKAATLGIRGTEFTTRICATKNCQDEGSIAAPVKPSFAAPRAVGRVILIQGELAVAQPSGGSRKLIFGAPVFEGDTLKSSAKSHAVVAFRDGARITLQENSDFLVEKYKYEKDSAQESAILRLLKGSVRVVTGLIGRLHHDDFKFNVSGAVIGIRGTGFDAWCNGPCAEGKADFGATPGNPLDGAGVFVWSGEVVLVSPGGSFTVAINQAAIITRETGKPVQIRAIPAGIRDNPAPKPDSVPVDVDKLFEESPENGDQGLYVTVHDGQVILALGDKKIDLGRDESGFTNDVLLTRLSSTPGFMRGDKKLENLERIGGKNSGVIPSGGCVIAP
jgi:hypothetical protein